MLTTPHPTAPPRPGLRARHRLCWLPSQLAVRHLDPARGSIHTACRQRALHDTIVAVNSIPVPCTEPGCDAIVRVPRSLYDDHDELIGLRCGNGHIFDYAKARCPRCGHEATPAEWRPLQVWTGTTTPPPRSPVFHPARCNSPDCDWQGPKA